MGPLGGDLPVARRQSAWSGHAATSSRSTNPAAASGRPRSPMPWAWTERDVPAAAGPGAIVPGKDRFDRAARDGNLSVRAALRPLSSRRFGPARAPTV